MKKIVESFLYLLFLIREKMLLRKMGFNSNQDFSLAASKTTLNENFVFSLKLKEEEKEQKVQNDVRIILKMNKYNIQKIFEYIEKNGFKVYVRKKINNVLRSVGENQGFINYCSGIKAAFLSFVITGKISFNFDDVFIFDEENLDLYLIVYNFYMWYAKRAKLDGFSKSGLENLKKYFNNPNFNFEKLKLKEMVEFQDAVKRDKVAVNFAIEFAKNTEGSKNAMNKMSQGGASI